MNFTHKSTGDYFEQYAEKELKKIGFKIIARNYKSINHEIDIIAKQNDIITFVEIKARNENSKIFPVEAISSKKIQNIAECAHFFLNKLEEKNIDTSKLEKCFDVVGIVYDDDYIVKEINYYKNYYKILI